MEPPRLGTPLVSPWCGTTPGWGLGWSGVPDPCPASPPQSRHGWSGGPGVPVLAAAAVPGRVFGAGAARKPRRCRAPAVPPRCRNVPPRPAQVPALGDAGTPSPVCPPPSRVAPPPAMAMGSERRATPAACPERTLQGTVVSATGAALPDARIYLEGRPPVLLARSDADGRFTAAGLCEGTAANISAHREGFAPGLAPIVSNGSGLAVANVTLQRLGEYRGAGHGAEPCNPRGISPKDAWWGGSDAGGGAATARCTLCRLPPLQRNPTWCCTPRRRCGWPGRR